MASNNNDAGLLWEEEKKEWNTKKTVILTLLGLLAILFAFHGAFATKLLVQISVALLLAMIALYALPSKWLRLVWMIGTILVFVAFKRGLVDSLLTACFILLLASLAVIQTLPPRRRNFLRAISFVAFFFALFSVWIYRLLSEETVTKMGFLKFLVEGQFARMFFSGFVGLLGALLVIGIPLLILLWPSSEYVLALHEVDGIKRRDALRLLWSLVMGTQLPWQVVEDGEVKQTKPEGILDKIGGPGVVVIKPGNAVVFERKGKVTRIEGPGVVLTKRFEKAKHVIDLRPQWATVKAENVLTKDRVPLTIELGVGYRIELKKDTDERLESVLETDGEAFTREIGEVYRVYEETVRKAAYNVTAAGWQTTTREAAKTFLRDIVATCNFDDIFVLNGTELEENKRAIHKIEEAVKKKLAKAAVNWGVKITTIDIENIEMPEEAEEQLLALWKAEWRTRTALKEAEGEKEVMRLKAEGAKEALTIKAEGEREAWITRGEGQAEAIARIERIKTRAVEEMVNQLLRGIRDVEKRQVDPKVIERFVFLVESLATGLIYNDLTAERYIEALEKLAESEAVKTLFIGEDRRFFRTGRWPPEE